MAGTKAGGAKARDTKLKKYGPDHFRQIGAKGGLGDRPRPFSIDRELAKRAGAKGVAARRKRRNDTN